MAATANQALAWSHNPRVRWFVADGLKRGFNIETIDAEIGIPGITVAVAGDAATQNEARSNGFADFDVALKSHLVSEAPKSGLRKWLKERSIPQRTFYEWRKEFGNG